MICESNSTALSKCIYTRLAYSQVLAFCKISENRHTFAGLRFVKDDGLPAFYSPDFLLRTADATNLAETKAQQQTVLLNVQCKLKAAMSWCERINQSAPEHCSGLPWHDVLLAEDVALGLTQSRPSVVAPPCRTKRTACGGVPSWDNFA
ncbi:MAG: hypothetical protein PHH58_15580 [Rhodoferax sp.]|nr:hypothetical protein [Rhodoferax sp.]